MVDNIDDKNKSPQVDNPTSPLVHKSTSGQADKSASPQLDIKKRKYYEVFGDYVSRVNFQQTLIIILVCIIVFLIVLLAQTIKKPPIVIRVDSLGQAEAFENVKSYQNITEPELINFTNLFVNYYTSYNFYSIKDDFKHAGQMMTENMFNKANSIIRTNNTIENVQTKQLKTETKLTHINVLKDTPDFVAVKVKGTRFITSYNNPEYKAEESFDMELSIKKVKRSLDTPYGLLVDNFSEELYKQ